MPKVRFIQKRIFDIEGFEVTIRSLDGKKDIRDDYFIDKQYEADRMSKNSFSVQDWKKKFKRQFPGFEIDVLMGDGSKARGQMKLSTVRDSYLEEGEG